MACFNGLKNEFSLKKLQIIFLTLWPKAQQMHLFTKHFRWCLLGAIMIEIDSNKCLPSVHQHVKFPKQDLKKAIILWIDAQLFCLCSSHLNSNYIMAHLETSLEMLTPKKKKKETPTMYRLWKTNRCYIALHFVQFNTIDIQIVKVKLNHRNVCFA